jgi:hypothetical protein
MVVRLLLAVVVIGLLLLAWAVVIDAPAPVLRDGRLRTDASRNPGSDPIPAQFPDNLPRPSSDYSPAEVVQVIVRALRDNDSPVPQAGVATTFGFASPENQQLTGPLDRFIDMVNSDAYSPMLNHRRAVFGRLTQDGPRARQLVTLYGDSAEPACYLFVLVRQPEGDRAGCWLTDGVLRLTPEQAAEERRKDPTRDL